MASQTEIGRGNGLMEPLLRPGEVAAALAVSPRTVVRLVETGALAGIRVGGQVRIAREDLEEFLAAGRR